MIGMSAHKQFLSIQDCISGQNNRQRLNNCIAFFFGMQARPSLKTSSSKARSCDPSKLFHRKLAPAIPQNLFITDFLVFDCVLSLQVCFFSVFVAFCLQVERNTSFISWFHIDCGMVSMWALINLVGEYTIFLHRTYKSSKNKHKKNNFRNLFLSSASFNIACVITML